MPCMACFQEHGAIRKNCVNHVTLIEVVNFSSENRQMRSDKKPCQIRTAERLVEA